MARFRYRMQNILNVKEKLEEQAKNDFAIAAGRLREQEAILEELKNRKIQYENDLKKLYESSMDIDRINKTQDAIEVIKYHITQQQLKVRAANSELEAARQKLTAAMQDRKTHERLKEKQFEEFLKDEAAKESKEIDELVSFRHGEKLNG